MSARCTSTQTTKSSTAKIAGVDDLVTFEGTTVADLAASFRDAVEDYIALQETLLRAVGLA